MKKTLHFISLIMISAISVLFFSCDDEESSTDRGKKAAQEFCDCRENYSEDKCNENMNDDYRGAFDKEFKNAFDKEGAKCGIELTLIY